MPKSIAIGEESWIRRDFQNRGGSFFLRELLIGLYPIMTLGGVTFGIVLIMVIFQRDIAGFGSHYRIYLLILAFLFFTFFAIACTWIPILRLSQFCPLWVHAEKINISYLTIYHFYRKPTLIKLNSTKINKGIFFTNYMSISLTSIDNDNCVHLIILTPEEYDRFMQYWNAANPQDTEAS